MCGRNPMGCTHDFWPDCSGQSLLRLPNVTALKGFGVVLADEYPDISG